MGFNPLQWIRNLWSTPAKGSAESGDDVGQETGPTPHPYLLCPTGRYIPGLGK